MADTRSIRGNHRVPGLVAKAFKQQKGRCWLCGHAMLLVWGSNHPLALSRDHVKPRADGGYDKWRNYRLAHRTCNTARDRMAPEVFRATVGDAAYWKAKNKRTPVHAR